MEDGLGYEWFPKALVYGLGQLALGAAVLRWLSRDLALAPWLARVAVRIALLLVIALLARAWTHTVSAFGLEEAWLPDNLRLIALESRWGGNWRVQFYAALALAGSAVLIRVRGAGWTAYAVSAAALAAAMPLLGHASGDLARHLLHAGHNLASAAWLGTLGVITLTALRSHTSRTDAPVVAGLVARFSPIALSAAGVVLASGVVAASIYLGSLDALWTSRYGQILLVKLGLVGVVLACGWLNWRRVRAGLPPRVATMTLEWLAALAVVAVTGVLTESEHP